MDQRYVEAAAKQMREMRENINAKRFETGWFSGNLLAVDLVKSGVYKTTADYISDRTMYAKGAKAILDAAGKPYGLKFDAKRSKLMNQTMMKWDD